MSPSPCCLFVGGLLLALGSSVVGDWWRLWMGWAASPSGAIATQRRRAAGACINPSNPSATHNAGTHRSGKGAPCSKLSAR